LELMIAIGIIIVLGAILIAGMKSITTGSKANAAKMDLNNARGMLAELEATSKDDYQMIKSAFTAPIVAPNDMAGTNNVPASVFLLLRERLLTPEVLVCPSALSSDLVSPDDYGNKDSALQRKNFSDVTRNLSYGFQVMFPRTTATQEGWVWDTSLEPEAVLAADIGSAVVAAGINPTHDADPDQYTNKPYGANIQNHRGLLGKRDGQNVLFGDMHVEFKDSPYCGQQRSDIAPANTKFRDNIYTANPPGAADEGGQLQDNTARPAKQADSVLLPVK
jgi:type II secretory pathway pseudopilin PulG